MDKVGVIDDDQQSRPRVRLQRTNLLLTEVHPKSVVPSGWRTEVEHGWLHMKGACGIGRVEAVQ